METYREKLKIQRVVVILCICLLLPFAFGGILSEAGLIPFPVPAAGGDHWQSMWRGFISGAACGLSCLLIVGLVRIRAALSNGKKLRQLYVKDHDERTAQIWTSARAAGTQVFLLLGLAATIIAGYFSVSICLTILCCVLFLSLSCLVCKLYYSRKF